MTVWNVTAFNGYVPRTTFWNDFEIAEVFGENAVVDTYERAMKNWAGNFVYLTELVMVLNHRLWMHYEQGNDAFARLYDMLWSKASAYACENLKGDELRYYLEVTD